MTIEDVHMVIDKINDVRKQAGKAKMDLAVGWTRMAQQELDKLDCELIQLQRDIILRKTIQVIQSDPNGVYTDD